MGIKAKVTRMIGNWMEKNREKMCIRDRLEVMEEGKITVDGVSHEMPQPYTVIATQNPLGFAGTQELPESQIDRFMVCLSMGYPTYEDEVRILRQKHGDKPPAAIAPVVSREEVCHMQREAARVYVADELYQYAALLAHTSRGHKGLRLGLSPRAVSYTHLDVYKRQQQHISERCECQRLFFIHNALNSCQGVCNRRRSHAAGAMYRGVAGAAVVDIQAAFDAVIAKAG